MRIIILGGGFIGQLIHVMFPKARVFDWRPKAPSKSSRSFGPQYLWESIEELPCKRFDVLTTIDGEMPTPDAIFAYKQKVGKEQDGGDCLAQFRPHMNGWDCQLPEPRVEYGRHVIRIDTNQKLLDLQGGTVERYDILLNTIPLYALLSICGHAHTIRHFRYKPIYMSYLPHISEHNPAPLREMHVNYISVPDTSIYRETIRDGQLFRESLEPNGYQVLIPSIKLTPGKIYPNPDAGTYLDQLARDDIFCYGRYATWDSDELAHRTLANVRAFKKAIAV
jgi:hypothetical protein